MVSDATGNWVFLGDSLTEGVGSSRVSYVSELRSFLPKQAAFSTINVHEFRLRRVNPDTFNPYIRCNAAGMIDEDGRPNFGRSLWLWNLASEGSTIESDRHWLPFIESLRPERVFILRGGLESVLRPVEWHLGDWPAWIPLTWRGYAALDPRCYFSDTWWRKAKQVSIDAAKQRLRHRLLDQRRGRPMLSPETFDAELRKLLGSLRAVCHNMHVIGLLPIEESTFPGSAGQFAQVNLILEKAAKDHGASYLDWVAQIQPILNRQFFYRDGFHPNQTGARVMAQHLFHHLLGQ